MLSRRRSERQRATEPMSILPGCVSVRMKVGVLDHIEPPAESPGFVGVCVIFSLFDLYKSTDLLCARIFFLTLHL